jgi:copper resistance protein C
MRQLTTGAVAALALASVSNVPALAHAYLVDSVPAMKQEVMNPPDRIRLVFSGRADAHFSTAELLDESGAVVTRVTQQKAAREMTLPAAALPPGQYRVHYRVLSVDGDIVEGNVEFAVVNAAD